MPICYVAVIGASVRLSLDKRHIMPKRVDRIVCHDFGKIVVGKIRIAAGAMPIADPPLCCTGRIDLSVPYRYVSRGLDHPIGDLLNAVFVFEIKSACGTMPDVGNTVLGTGSGDSRYKRHIMPECIDIGFRYLPSSVLVRKT